jgi:branched-chain amino acid transport system substrate-binding protein
MKFTSKMVLALICCCSLIFLTAYGPSMALAAKADKKAATKTDRKAAANKEYPDKLGPVKASFDADKMGDMSDFDPGNPITPTGDTIKIALVMPFSGPAALIGQSWYLYFQWAAHDYNKRGGIWVDGKKKMIELIKADHMSKQDQCKKIAERMILQEKVHVLVGSESTPNMKVLQETANRYKIIAHNAAAMSDDLMDATNFNRYTFQTTYVTGQFGRGLAYYYGQIRKKEKKFYILCQDYGYGHSVADEFKRGLKDYYPEAQIVGEDYHKLFLTDFAPYLTKIKAAEAEVVFTGDWYPDHYNLIKQARSYGIKIPIAGKDADSAMLLGQLGSVEATKNLVSITQYNVANPTFKTAQQKKYHKIWTNLWETKWKTPPYNSELFKYGEQLTGHVVMQAYWLLSVIERARSTDPEAIIKIWENDRFRTLAGKVVTMRGCDHRVVQDMAVMELVPPGQQKISYNMPPYYWFKDFCFTGPVSVIPAEKVLPFMDQKLDRCAGKNDWGE